MTNRWMDGWINGRWIDRLMDGCSKTNEWINGWIDGSRSGLWRCTVAWIFSTFYLDQANEIEEQ